jgi:S-(hydroxymethyl)glutathione dehydrogenase/alcohol dehydrogenase
MISARAALLYGPGQDYKIDTIEIDEPGPGEVLVEMRACGMCHSDEHVRTGDLPLPHYPVINGHEGAGEVAGVGEGVTSVAPGDHVAMAFIPSCGSCASCRAGQAIQCDLGNKH